MALSSHYSITVTSSLFRSFNKSTILYHSVATSLYHSVTTDFFPSSRFLHHTPGDTALLHSFWDTYVLLLYLPTGAEKNTQSVQRHCGVHSGGVPGADGDRLLLAKGRDGSGKDRPQETAISTMHVLYCSDTPPLPTPNPPPSRPTIPPIEVSSKLAFLSLAFVPSHMWAPLVCHQVARALNEKGVVAAEYHGGLDKKLRDRYQDG